MKPTIRQHLEKILVTDYMMWEEDAKTIVQLTTEREGQESMKGRWDDLAEGYSPNFLTMLLMSVKLTGREWLAEHAPMHFARPLFE